MVARKSDTKAILNRLNELERQLHQCKQFDSFLLNNILKVQANDIANLQINMESLQSLLIETKKLLTEEELLAKGEEILEKKKEAAKAETTEEKSEEGESNE